MIPGLEGYSDAELADRAERLMEDPMFRYLFEEVRKQTLVEWQAARTVDARERAHALYTGVDRLENVLRIIAGQGAHLVQTIEDS